MTVKELVLKNRSYRRFDESYRIDKQTLIELVDLARNSASARNLQVLKYYISYSQEINDKIFPQLAWAAYLQDWKGPETGEKPTAYIIILADKKLSSNFYCDHGIAAQSILLGATEKKLGGCMIAAFKRQKLTELLQLDEHLEILLVVAIGKPSENVVLTEMTDNKHEYWRDENGTHYVPKRSLNEIIVS